MNKIIKTVLLTLTFVLIVTSLTGCVFLLENGSIDNLPDSGASAHSIVYNQSTNEQRQKMAKEDAIEKVRRSVVAIRMPHSDSTSSYGSGVIVDIGRTDEKGKNLDDENVFYILTCYHVIDTCGDIIVYVPDEECDNWGENDYNQDFAFSGKIGGTFNGEVTLVGGDQESDIALLKLDLKGSGVSSDKIVKATLAPADNEYKMKVGEDVFAIGNPSGLLPGTVSVGTISYINRETSVSSIGNMTLLQINTDIFHGSSGGALFNMYGEVVGVTNAGSDEYVGICYSIPYVIDPANGNKDKGFVNVASHLLGSYTGTNYGYVSGRLEKFGFTAGEVLGENGVVKISSIVSLSQAETKGIKAEDIVQKVKVNDGEEVQITSLSQLSSIVESLEIGDNIQITLQRRKNYFEYTSVVVTLTAKQFIFCDTGNYPAK